MINKLFEFDLLFLCALCVSAVKSLVFGRSLLRKRNSPWRRGRRGEARQDEYVDSTYSQSGRGNRMNNIPPDYCLSLRTLRLCGEKLGFLGALSCASAIHLGAEDAEEKQGKMNMWTALILSQGAATE